MKACLMKVNYDPQYTKRHQTQRVPDSASNQYRYSLTKEIYGNTKSKDYVDLERRKKIKSLIDKSSKDGKEKKKAWSLEDDTLKSSKKSSPDKVQEHKEGVARAHTNIKLQPIHSNSTSSSSWSKQTTSLPKKSKTHSQTNCQFQDSRNAKRLNSQTSVGTTANYLRSPDSVRIWEERMREIEEGYNTRYKNDIARLDAEIKELEKVGSLRKLMDRNQMRQRQNTPTKEDFDRESFCQKWALSTYDESQPKIDDLHVQEFQHLDCGSLPYSRSKTLPPSIYHRKIKSAGTLEMERRAKKDVEKAVKDRKIFTIVGPYHSLRLAMRRRGWVERFMNMPECEFIPKPSTSTASQKQATSNSDIDGDNAKKIIPWEEDSGKYGVMSQMLKNCIPSFVFAVKSVDVDSRITKSGQLVNHFGKARMFTTKVGLCQNLRQVPWYVSMDPDTFYPRCYTLVDQDEKDTFMEDYRLTACLGFLKYLVQIHEQKKDRSKEWEKAAKNDIEVEDLTSSTNLSTKSENEENISPNTTESKPAKPRVPTKALDIAMRQCERYLKIKKHEDIDSLISTGMTESNWDEFLEWYNLFIHNGNELHPPPDVRKLKESKEMLEEMESCSDQFELDGYRNVWILKPGAKSRGRGIQCYDKNEQIKKMITESDQQNPLVAQKYIERPFLVYNTKFDIRQWFLVTDWNPLTFWFYDDCYLRFCSREYTLDDFHVAIHLSNNSVQKNFTPGPRSSELPDDNMWTSEEFDKFLRKTGHGTVWSKTIVPGMKNAILCTLLCTQEYIECRKSAFELYGADFMLTEDMQPWLIEINSSPSMARNTRVTRKMVDSVMEDTLKVVLDKRADKGCDTGRFTLAYKQQAIPDPPMMDLSLQVQGKKIRKKILDKR